MKTVTQSLSETCALVQVSFTRFNPVVQRRDLANDFEAANNAENKTTKLSVNLLKRTECPSFDAIAKLDGSIRNHVIYEWTTPTRVNGVRLTTNAALPMLKERLQAHHERRRGLVRTFATEEWPIAVRTAPERLGNLYRERDFPSSDDVMRAYRMNVRFTALSDADPKIVGVPDDVLRMIERETQREHEDLRNLAFRQIVDKLHEQLTHAADSLENYEVVKEWDDEREKHVEKRKNPFRDSLILNLWDRAKQAHALDITVDSDVRKVADRILAYLKGDVIDLDAQRNSAKLRKASVANLRGFIKEMEDAGLVERARSEEIDHLFEADADLLF